ncbi:hypothetical protein [Pseudomonas sp. ok266]|uniref:hypothetical protein n=1 Tax=Pseudomonas sp. ok266 TaxID=1761896 RepID=UPI0021140D2D|nr:hypothetical protein [Pseudomonas sp. ok266]
MTLPVDMAAAGQAIELAGVDMEKNILREIADTATDGFYGWIAGESTAVMNIAQIPDQRAWHTS